jgi:hypothetical protein
MIRKFSKLRPSKLTFPSAYAKNLMIYRSGDLPECTGMSDPLQGSNITHLPLVISWRPNLFSMLFEFPVQSDNVFGVVQLPLARGNLPGWFEEDRNLVLGNQLPLFEGRTCEPFCRADLRLPSFQSPVTQNEHRILLHSRHFNETGFGPWLSPHNVCQGSPLKRGRDGIYTRSSPAVDGFGRCHGVWLPVSACFEPLCRGRGEASN